MNHLKKSSIKYKYLTFDELVVNLDRLSRFKHPDYAFSRVFNSILLKNLIYPKYSKKDIDNLDAEYVSMLIKEIWNNSVKNLYGEVLYSDIPIKTIKTINKYYFKNIDKKTKIFLNTKLAINQILNEIDPNNASMNIKFLIKVNQKLKINQINIENLVKVREKYALKYPIKKLLIVEGITEEILLPVFSEKLKHNLDKEGIFILGAGGKSKSPTLYLELKDNLKIPVILLFDADANEIYKKLSTLILKKDKILIINKGEFEDILSTNLIKRSLNKEYLPASPLLINDLHITNKMCNNIDLFYKSRHLGEYKKSKFSKIIAQNVKYKTDITPDIKDLINEII